MKNKGNGSELLDIINTEEWVLVIIIYYTKNKRNKIRSICSMWIFRGWTLVRHFCIVKYNYDIEFHGFDTFGGFGDVVSNSNDEPTQFIDLFENGGIDREHFDGKRKTNNFKGLNHLSEKYFSDVQNVLTFESYFQFIC